MSTNQETSGTSLGQFGLGQAEREALNYNRQCLTAIARALPSGDDYRRTIKIQMKEDLGWTMEEFTYADPGIPVFCGKGSVVASGEPLTLRNVREHEGDSHIANLYKRYWNSVTIDKPKAMFIQLDGPKRLNVVVHMLNDFRTSWDPAVLLLTRPSGIPLFIEPRTTFCRLLAGIGPWSLDRPGRIVPFEFDYATDDLRRERPENLLRVAIRVAAKWGHRRTRSLMFRDLTDKQFISKVMQMQMERRVKTGSWE